MPVPNPPRIVQLPADHSISRGGHQPLVIVAHDTEGTDSRNTLQHGDGRFVSVHRLIQKFPRANKTTDILPGGSERLKSGVIIYDMVPDDQGANHAGFSTWQHNGVTYSPMTVNVNVISLSFELECLGAKNKDDRYTDDQLLAAGWLINAWRAKYGPLPLVRHAEIDPTRRSDPVNLSVADLERWADAAVLAFGPGRRVYVSRGVPIYQRQSLTGPVAAYLAQGETVAIDVVYPNGAGHDALGRGFVRLADMEPVP